MEKLTAKKIMIVDDDPDLLVFLRTLFEQHSYEVLAVDSGMDCLEELKRGFKGVILMDLLMPFMDGWTTIQEIIKQGFQKNITLSIITASGRADPEKMRGLEPFIHSYIQKPFDLEQLVREVNDANLSLFTAAAH
ncbi:MAG TPA: response regulator [Candidatus Thermoplasmatota archaeon]|nr:response regulator [Candidatus Thermoplasmatota archaeon]